MQAPDFESIHKIPAEHRYFNISTKWIAYYPWMIRTFYRLGIRHEVVTGLSIVSGLTAAALIGSLPGSGLFLAAVLTVHLKDVFDASDGALARITGTGHRLGRFVDTIGDGVVFTLWIGACALVMAKAGAPAPIAAATRSYGAATTGVPTGNPTDSAASLVRRPRGAETTSASSD
ncbi:MAG: CDP-alcohol phosphatidyltransferase family protein, partial [Actinobacteria bacterium]|nr:CDP-alcohol phosphatidyltransferase family protein [Actinomycetota bacterium]